MWDLLVLLLVTYVTSFSLSRLFLYPTYLLISVISPLNKISNFFSRPFRYWNCNNFILRYNAISVPYEVTFLGSGATLPTQIRQFNKLADMVFVLDVLLNFVKTYENNRGQIVFDLRAIRKNYLTSWFIVDFPAALAPLLEHTVSEQYERASYLKIVRLLRLQRFSKVIFGTP